MASFDQRTLKKSMRDSIGGDVRTELAAELDGNLCDSYSPIDNRVPASSCYGCEDLPVPNRSTPGSQDPPLGFVRGHVSGQVAIGKDIQQTAEYHFHSHHVADAENATGLVATQLYAEKLRSARSLMEPAAELHREVRVFVWKNEPDSRDSAIEFWRRSDDWFASVQSLAWLLGVDVRSAAVQFHGVLRKSLAPKIFTPTDPYVEGVFEIDENTWEPVSGYIAAFNELAQAVQAELKC